MTQEMTAEQFVTRFQRGKARLARGRTAGASHDQDMNQTERAYSLHLEERRVKGEIVWWAFHAFRIPLGDRSWYTPDFVVQMADHTIEVHEVKGWATEQHALLQIKWATQVWPIFTFRSFTKRAKKDGGGWTERTFGGHP